MTKKKNDYKDSQQFPSLQESLYSQKCQDLFSEIKLKTSKYMSAKRPVTFSQTFVKKSGQDIHTILI